jgi:hypothetical protein
LGLDRTEMHIVEMQRHGGFGHQRGADAGAHQASMEWIWLSDWMVTGGPRP